jgi:hypothetical protein
MSKNGSQNETGAVPTPPLVFEPTGLLGKRKRTPENEVPAPIPSADEPELKAGADKRSEGSTPTVAAENVNEESGMPVAKRARSAEMMPVDPTTREGPNPDVGAAVSISHGGGLSEEVRRTIEGALPMLRKVSKGKTGLTEEVS